MSHLYNWFVTSICLQNDIPLNCVWLESLIKLRKLHLNVPMVSRLPIVQKLKRKYQVVLDAWCLAMDEFQLDTTLL